MALSKLGDYIEQADLRNREGIYPLDSVRGISIQKCFISTKANMENVPLSNYKIVSPNQFSYVTITSRNGGKISLAHNDTQESYLVSSSYLVFFIKNPADFKLVFKVFKTQETRKTARKVLQKNKSQPEIHKTISGKTSFLQYLPCENLDFGVPSIQISAQKSINK